MGGNALKNTKTVRLDSCEYFKIEKEVISKLSCFNMRVEPIKAYSEKESFGDLDILIEYQDGVDYMELVKSFSPNEIFKNGKVISFDFKQFQVDLIITRPEFFEFSLVYYSFNDLGNLMGRTAHEIGLSYGHEGLYSRVNFQNRTTKILLSRDIEETFKILGYDYSIFKNGFNNLKDIFEYTLSSRFFNVNSCLFENRNHRSRVRDKKRPTYNAFLDFCKDKKLSPNVNYNKDYFSSYIEDCFPAFRKKKDNFIKESKNAIDFKSKFNGKIVMENSSMKGKDLGVFIKRVKTPCFYTFVLNNDKDAVLKRTIDLIKKYQ